MNPQKKFIQLLRELFQFESADLDFGIYRIMNHKRQIIEHWISEDLPNTIKEELSRGSLNEQQKANEELAAAKEEVLRTLGENAINAEGILENQYHSTPVGRKYLEAFANATNTHSSQVLETTIYNHLYTFFSRYWQDGDFISKRRYSRKERYAIPYNGEEVTLYWANQDQYYVKTGEYFTDYSWRAHNSVTINFKIQEADVEQNNVKGEKRFFLPVPEDTFWNEETRTLNIPFEYRPLKKDEVRTYGNRNQQNKINEATIQMVPKRFENNLEALEALKGEKYRDASGNSISNLEHHIRQYTARNSRDYFIHKDLRGFLLRELDFYLKNEVLNLDELEVAGEDLSEGWFQMIRLIKSIGSKIVDFLAQIEDIQKMLWEKRKFVTETQYCILVGAIGEDHYYNIAKCDAQWDEWKELFCIDEEQSNIFTIDKSKEENRVALLKANPTLVLDTKYFSEDFVDTILGSVKDLTDLLDGVLVHGDNFAAISLLSATYAKAVDFVYSDPPYNTGNNDFVYKDSYRHSSWLAMMNSRLTAVKPLLSDKAVLFFSIDDEEAARLALLLSKHFSDDSFLAWIAYERSGSSGLGQGGAIVNTKEHILSYCMDKSHLNDVMYERPIEIDVLRRYNKRLVNQGEREVVSSFTAPSTGEQVSVYKHDGDVIHTISLRDFERRQDEILAEYSEHFDSVFRLTSIQRENSFQHEILSRCGDGLYSADYLVSRGRYAGQRITTFYYNRQIFVWLRDSARLENNKILKLNKITDQWPHAEIPKADLANEGGVTLSRGKKPEQLLSRLIHWGSDKSSIVLDFFLGSGTTTAVAAKLGRKYIGIDCESYFREKPLRRMKRVLYGEQSGISKQSEWKGGGAFKYIQLESYEDALSNINFDIETGQQALSLFKDEYLLHYMLSWETRKSETLLNVEKLQSPFSYKLRIYRDGGTREQTVDLPETFNYLIGLTVQSRRAYFDEERRYLVYRGVTRENRKMVVIWRETLGWAKSNYERDATFVENQNMIEDADEILVNNDSYILGAHSLDPIFKEAMFKGVTG